MNWAQVKDPVSHMCLAGTVVSNTRGSYVAFLRIVTVMTNILSLDSLNSVKTFRKNSIVFFTCNVKKIKSAA